MTIRVLFLALLLCLLSAPLVSQAKKLKVYISVDMEGISGVVTDDQLGPSGFEYSRYREVMTREALAAVRAAKDKDVRIIRSWPRRLSMMAGIDSTFDAVIFIGYH